MYKQNCDGCLWRGKCYSPDGCEYYDPLDDGDGTEKYIEEHRKEFYAEWLIYVTEE